MKKIITLPHHMHESTCYVNGLFDVLSWKGARYDYFLLPVIGGMMSFAYLKFKMATPTCMVYWGTNSKYLLRDLGEIIGFTQYTSEGKSFKNEFPLIKHYIDHDEPVMVGALDMYYLHYYPELYLKEHVPIHYLLVMGYDDEKSVVYVHDCSMEGVQEISYDEFEKSLNVNVPGMSKKNTYRVFSIPEVLPSELSIAEKGLTRKAAHMLKPPVSMFGIPAMRKLAKEITGWTDRNCYTHMAAYAGMTPPLVAEDLSHNDGARFEQARVLKELGLKYDKKQWTEASGLFVQSGELIIRLSGEALAYNGKACSKTLSDIADLEEKGYITLIQGQV